MTKSFDQIPVVDMSDDWGSEVPQILAQLAQQHGPIFKREWPQHLQPFYGKWVIYMVGPEANRFVMQSHREHFSHDMGWTPIIGDIFPKGLLNTDEPEHARQRKIMNPAFSIAYMTKYLPLMQKVIEERTRDWAERGTIDIYAETRKITFDVAATALVGFQTGPEVDRLRQLFYTLIGPGTTAQTQEEWWQQVVAAKQELTANLLKLIATRRQKPTDDILGILVNTRDEDGESFSDEELLGQLNILLVAGHETTTTMSAWLLYLLANSSDYLARVHSELETVLAGTGGEVTLEAIKSLRVLGNAVDEAGRMYPPVVVAPRGVAKEFEFAGYSVPAGQLLRVGLAGSHYLPDIFENPTKFDPDRFAAPREEDKRHPYSLVTFGGGPRVCIGMSFAQIEMKALAAHVLRRYSLTPLEKQADVAVFYGITTSLPQGLHLQVKPLA